MKVELIDHMGSDLSVVNAARVSFDKESEMVFLGGAEELSAKDVSLISYLAKHNHWTPFAHCFASFRIKAPIFVARQLGKHQVGLAWNEVSRRYVDSEPEMYVPKEWRLAAANVKQGSSSDVYVGRLTDGTEGQAPRSLMNICVRHYKHLLSLGICAEQARMVLPQAMYTEWIWSGSIAAFARVVKLRTDPHTQLETQEIAVLIDQLLTYQFPYSWKALTNG